MSLYEHAERELYHAGLLSPDSDYDGKLGRATLELVKVFADQGHSGASAGMVVELFTRVATYDNLTPLTSNPDEWGKIVNEMLTDSQQVTGLWQSKRRSSSFSRDGGKTWYDIDDPEQNNGDVWHHEADGWVPLELGTNARIGERVRVRLDAFGPETRAAQLHNGRVGDLILVDGGRCAVRYEDGHEFRFLPSLLEVLEA